MLARLTLTAGLLLGTAASAECAFEADVPIRGITAGFPAWVAIADGMEECGDVEIELDQEIRTKAPPALAANPALYHMVSVHNGTITPLLNEGTIRPLGDLIERFGQDLKPNQLITIDGEVMAVAFMVNMQHLFYRKDILADLGIEPPATYDELFAAAETIQEAGVVDYPLGATLKADWNIAIEFNNLFSGYGGEWVDDAGMPTVNTEAGVKALETLKALSEYLDPEYLTADATYVQQQFQQGKIAMANFWASRAGRMNDEGESTVVGLIGTASAPAAVEGGPPAALYSWDGFAIAANITDEEAEAAFRVALEGGDAETAAANNDAAVWLIDGYVPTDMAQGAIATVENGAPSAPSATWRGLIDGAIESNVAAYMTGGKTAEEALSDIESDYLVAAREAGIVD